MGSKKDKKKKKRNITNGLQKSKIIASVAYTEFFVFYKKKIYRIHLAFCRAAKICDICGAHLLGSRTICFSFVEIWEGFKFLSKENIRILQCVAVNFILYFINVMLKLIIHFVKYIDQMKILNHVTCRWT